jgi:hypothetical protein
MHRRGMVREIGCRRYWKYPILVSTMAKSCCNMRFAKRNTVVLDFGTAEEIAKPLHGTLRLCSCHNLVEDQDGCVVSNDFVSRQDLGFTDLALFLFQRFVITHMMRPRRVKPALN